MHCSHDLEFARLPATERLVLVTLRARLGNFPGAAALESLYRIACGLAWVERTVAAFEAMTCTLAAGTRRPFRVRHPASEDVSVDEQCLLALLAAHQLGARVQAEARTIWLVGPEFHADMQRCAGTFADALARSGCRLSGTWMLGVKPFADRPARGSDAPGPVRSGFEEARG